MSKDEVLVMRFRIYNLIFQYQIQDLIVLPKTDPILRDNTLVKLLTPTLAFIAGINHPANWDPG